MTDGAGGRRRFLKGLAAGSLGSTAALTAFSEQALALDPDDARLVHERVESTGVNDARDRSGRAPKIRFAVCGMSHDHIYEMVEVVRRGGGELVSAYSTEAENIVRFKARFPQARIAAGEDEILEDRSIQLVLCAAMPNERAAIAVRAMQHGKDVLSDKPAATTLEQIQAIRTTVAQTERLLAIFYSERLNVKAATTAGDLVHSGAIGKVIHTINIAPHQIVPPGVDVTRGGRPDWFWDPQRCGGILCDIGSHQVDQFLYYTGSKHAQVVASQVANAAHPSKPQFQDFGDMLLRGDKGTGYARLDWLTPDGLGTWGDGRLFILGTAGFIEVRKYVDIARSKQQNMLYVVDNRGARLIDCNAVALPFGGQLVDDILNRTTLAQDPSQALLAAELAVRAQMQARTVHLAV